MKLECIHCPYVATSLLIGKEESLKDCIQIFLKHLFQKHPNENKSIMTDAMKVTSIATSIIMFSKHTKLLDRELDVTDYMQEQFHNMIEEFQNALGVDVSDTKENSKPLSIIDMNPNLPSM